MNVNTFFWELMCGRCCSLAIRLVVLSGIAIIILLPSPAWAEGTVLSWFVCVCVCVYVCLSVTTKLLFKLNYLKI